MNISIGKNGQYERDQEALEFLSPTEDEYLAALARKLAIRQEQSVIRNERRQALEQERAARKEAKRIAREKEQAEIKKQREAAKAQEREEKRKQKELERQKIFSDLLDGKKPNY